jgi:thioredoxin 1
VDDRPVELVEVAELVERLGDLEIGGVAGGDRPTLPDGLAILSEASDEDSEAQMAGTVTEVTDSSFQAEVIESEVPVLVDFWAPWCGPCRMVAPVVEEIARERAAALKVVKLNIDENQQTATSFGVMSIPTLMLFRNGQQVKTVIGAYPKKKLEAELEPALA